MKVGNELRITGEVRIDGVLQDLSTWTMRSDLRRDSEIGTVIGSFTMSTPSLGQYVGVLNTTGLPNVAVFTDTRLIPPSGQPIITDTMSCVLTPAITA